MWVNFQVGYASKFTFIGLVYDEGWLDVNVLRHHGNQAPHTIQRRFVLVGDDDFPTGGNGYCALTCTSTTRGQNILIVLHQANMVLLEGFI